MEGQKPQITSDEIDLAQIFSRMGSGIRSAWMGFMRFLATLRRTPLENKLLFAIVIVISITFGVLFGTTWKTEYFESKMIFSSDYLNNKLAKSLVDKLDGLSRERSRHGLAIVLGLPDSVVQSIIGFEIKPYMTEEDNLNLEIFKEQLRAARTTANKKAIDDLIDKMEIENQHSYEITVRTLSPNVIQSLTEGIVHYFKSNPYIRKRVEVNEENLIGLKAQLKKDINKMDSLKLALYESYKNGSQGPTSVVVSENGSPAFIFTEGLSIYKLYGDATSNLYTGRDFEVVDGFTQFTDPASASLQTILIESFLVGVVLAYIIIALRNFNSYLANLQ